MSSKSQVVRNLTLLCWASFISILLGCGARLGETPPPNDTYGFTGAECLSTTTPIIKDYLKGTARTREVRALWDCIDSAVSQFKKNVRGSSADSYSSQELATFLEKNFFDKKKSVIIKPALQLEFMKIKQLLLGGSAQFITRKELDESVQVFSLLREVTVDLNPYMKIISMNWLVDKEKQSRTELDYFEESNFAIQKAAGTLVSLFEKNGQPYALTDFAGLMREVASFLGEDWSVNSTIEQYIPVAQKVKKALAGGNENIVAPNEWSRFSILGSRGYIQYLRYYYFIKSTEDLGVSYQLPYLARTVEDLLSVFEDLTAQKPEGVVSAQEVYDLLSTLSKNWVEFKVSNGLIAESMKVKQLLFGGDLTSFTAQDFNKGRLKVNQLKSLIERFMPYWTIYCEEWDQENYNPEEAQKLFMEAQLALSSTASEFGSLIEGSYDMRDLIKLAKEFEALYPPKNPDVSISKLITKYMSLAIDIKTTTLGGTGSILNKNHWGNLLNLGARFYTDFLYYIYFLDDKKISRPESLSRFSILSGQTLNITKDILKIKAGEKITANELSILANDLLNLKVFPAGIDQVSLNKIINVLLNNILISPENRINGKSDNALNLESIEVARTEFQIWLDTESFLAQLTEKWGAQDGMTASGLLVVIENQQSSIVSPTLLVGLEELAMALRGRIPMTFDGQGRLIISNKFQQSYNSKSLTQLNFSRALSRLILRSFAKDRERIDKYLGTTLPEVQETFHALKSIFVQLELLEERDDAFGDSRFRDANLFTPHSNGDQLASFTEVTDLVSMIGSGLKINLSFKTDLKKNCLKKVVDPKDHTLVNLNCAMESYKHSMANFMQATPEFLAYMKLARTNGDLDTYMLNVFKAAGYIDTPKKLVRWGDLSLAPHVVQYIEMLMAIYDTNKDGAITTAEALRAYSLFKSLLVRYAQEDIKSGALTEADLPAVFCWMLKFGKPPETTKEKLVFYFKWKGKRPDELDVWADRGSLASVLGYVADKSANVPVPEIHDIDQELSKLSKK